MSKRTTIRLITPLQEELKELAVEMGVSYNQLLNYALTQFVESQKGLALMEARGRRGSRRAFLRVLRKADRQRGAAAPEDRLPPGYNRTLVHRRTKRLHKEIRVGKAG